jgi:hypothetical protein
MLKACADTYLHGSLVEALSMPQRTRGLGCGHCVDFRPQSLPNATGVGYRHELGALMLIFIHT